MQFTETVQLSKFFINTGWRWHQAPVRKSRSNERFPTERKGKRNYKPKRRSREPRHNCTCSLSSINVGRAHVVISRAKFLDHIGLIMQFAVLGLEKAQNRCCTCAEKSYDGTKCQQKGDS